MKKFIIYEKRENRRQQQSQPEAVPKDLFIVM
jgi:hypothetical protein